MSVALQNNDCRWVRLVLSLCCALGVASAARPATHAGRNASADATRLISPFAIADFDGDEKLDIATVQAGQFGSSETRYWIHFQLSSGPRQNFALSAPMGGLHIAPRDVNGDNRPDLVVTSAWEHQPVAVLLNDGHGHFTARDPASFSASLWEAETSWVKAALPAPEIGAVAVPQNTWGSCGATQSFSSFAPQCGALPSSASHFGNSKPADFLLGRAPPVILLS